MRLAVLRGRDRRQNDRLSPWQQERRLAERRMDQALRAEFYDRAWVKPDDKRRAA